MQNIKKFAHDYNIMKSKTDQVSEFVCRVKQLSEYEAPLEITVCRESGGQWLLDEVCERFGSIQEKDYFGLRYTDKNKQRQWLDLGRNIYSQLKDSHPLTVSFRIKHYPASPLQDLKQSAACTCLYLQLRRDLFSGRLLGKSTELYQLAAYAAQCELGDFDMQSEDTSYISELKLLPNLHAKTEAKIVDIHKTLVGCNNNEAETKFLESAALLDTYGVEPFYVKDQKGNNLYVGLTHEGVSTFQGSRRAHLFKWSDISKIHYQGKLFIIQVFLDEVYNNQQTRKKHVLGFKCETSFAACALWKWANDRTCFFSLNRSSEAKKVKSGGGIFKKRQTFKFAGRCQHEIMQMSSSMMQINEHGSIILCRNNTLQRSNAVQDDFDLDEKTNFNTLPSRERGTMDTLDSIFKNQDLGSGDNASVQSSINSPLGSPKTEKKTQSMEHIAEERHRLSLDFIDGPTSKEYKKSASKGSSTKSSCNNLSSNGDPSAKGPQSEHNSDIAVALEQLNQAVSDAVTTEITKAVRQRNVGRHLVRCTCLACILMLGLSLVTLCSLLVMAAFSLRDNVDTGSVDYSGLLHDLVSRPRDFIGRHQVSEMARNCYFHVSKYFHD